MEFLKFQLFLSRNHLTIVCEGIAERQVRYNKQYDVYTIKTKF